MEMAHETTVRHIPVEDSSFEALFKSNFKRLFSYALTLLRDDSHAEEIVQNVFYKIWEKKGRIDIQTSVTAYLYRSVYNDCLNYLKHKKVKAAYVVYASWTQRNESDSATSKVQLNELKEKLDEALSELPEQCRTIFQMSRFEELKYQEIAARLGISVKTVENQMGKALRLLRTKLADYLPILIFILFNSVNSNNS
ncbi:MAG: RNA polymerase sigma-70 factor [Chitinophagaceae bacterium]|nr:RNA polymerase sigma-70 factor [Chitinophagaceae bacterium]